MAYTKNNNFTAQGTFYYSFTLSSDNSVMKMEFEPNNPYDSNAVMLLLNDQKIGYVPKSINKSINPSTSFIKEWTARINRGNDIQFSICTSPILQKMSQEEDLDDEELDEEALLAALEN